MRLKLKTFSPQTSLVCSCSYEKFDVTGPRLTALLMAHRRAEFALIKENSPESRLLSLLVLTWIVASNAEVVQGLRGRGRFSLQPTSRYGNLAYIRRAGEVNGSRL
jgi:hypothetical protein